MFKSPKKVVHLSMRNFLYSVAEDLWGRYGEGVSELTIVLPNNRSRVFLVDALCAVAGRPVWGPSYTSVDQLMSTASGLGHVDRILAITELFKIYSQYHPNETFDNFYHWGEVLLGDFDAVDKYLVDGRMLFANVADLRAITQDLTDLTPEQADCSVYFLWQKSDFLRLPYRRSKFRRDIYLKILWFL